MVPKLHGDGQRIEIAPLAYMRGRTLNDAFVILDEAQNTTPEQMKMFLTRIGYGSTAVVTGDMTQIDLPKHAEVRPERRARRAAQRQRHRLHLLQQPRRGPPPAGARASSDAYDARDAQDAASRRPGAA